MATDTTIANLRHLYQQMMTGAILDAAGMRCAAQGLLAPAIEALERNQERGNAIRKSISPEATSAVMQADFEQRQRRATTGEHDGN